MNLDVRVDRVWPIMLRELKLKTSYRVNAILGVITSFAGLISYAYLGNTALGSATSSEYGMSLVSFLVSGIAFSSIMNGGISMFFQHAVPSQIEEVMVTPIDFRLYLLVSSLVSILAALGGALLLFTTGTLLFGLSFSYNTSLIAANVALGVTASIGLGFLGLGFQLRYKGSYFLAWMLYTFSSLIGNMVVPVQALPSILRYVSYATPQYYFFTGIRAGLANSNAAGSSTLLGTFALYTLALALIGLFALKQGLASIKKNGTHRWT